MKSAKKKSLRKQTKTEEKQQDHMIIVKTESEHENGIHMNGDGLDIQIKEEPYSHEISEEHNGDSSGCSDTKPDTVTLTSDIHDEQAHIKEECDSDHQPEYEFTEAAVKEESEPWIKEEEGDSEEEAVEAEENEGVCTGREQEFGKNTIPVFLFVFTQVFVFSLIAADLKKHIV